MIGNIAALSRVSMGTGNLDPDTYMVGWHFRQAIRVRREITKHLALLIYVRTWS